MSNETPTDTLRLVPIEPTEKMLAQGKHAYAMTHEDDALRGAWAVMLAAAPASPLPEGGGPHERWSILNHLGGFWTPENFDTERQAVAYLDRWKRDNPKMDLSRHKVVPVLVTITAAPTGETRNGKGEG